MKDIKKYNKSVRLDRIVHVVIPSKTAETMPPRIEAISGEPNQPGKTLAIYTTPDIYKAVLGEREGNKIRPGLRGDQRHAFIGRFTDVKHGTKTLSVMVGLDRIPLRYFDGSSGPVEIKRNRIEGFIVEWDDNIKGFKIDKPELGMSRRDMERLLEEIRQGMGAKRSFKTASGYQITFLDEATLRVKNTAAFVEQSI